MRDELERLAGAAGRRASLPPAAAIRARGSRRRAAHAAMVALAAVLVTGLTMVAPQLVVPNRPADVALLPDNGFQMPHEGQPGWALDEDPRRRSAFLPCGAGQDPTQAGRVQARTITKGPLTYQVLVFNRVESAMAAMDALSQGAKDCEWKPVSDRPYSVDKGTELTWHAIVAYRPGFWDPRREETYVAWRDHTVFLYHLTNREQVGDTDLMPGLRNLGDELCTHLNVCAPNRCTALQPSPEPPLPVPCGWRSSSPTPR